MFCYLLFPLVLSSTGQGQDAPENDVTEHSTDEPTCVIAMEETPAPAPAVNEVDTNPASADVVDSNVIPGDSHETASGDEACILFLAFSFVVAYFFFGEFDARSYCRFLSTCIRKSQDALEF